MLSLSRLTASKQECCASCKEAVNIGSQRLASRMGDGTAALFEGKTSDTRNLKADQQTDLQHYATLLGVQNVTHKTIPDYKAAKGDELEVVIYYYHPDHLGSNTFVTDMVGLPYQMFVNLPFGEPMAEQTSTGYFQNPYKFNGKELDTETGLYYYGARYYDPRGSLWLSVDPMMEKYANFSPYSYTLNNPIKYIDPDGMNVSTHTDENGNVIAVYDDGNLGIYKHQGNGQQVKAELARNYSRDNISGGGDHMGWTLYSNSFTNDNGDPVGKIDYGSFAAKDWINNSEKEVTTSTLRNGGLFARTQYALFAGNGDFYDFKSQNGKGVYSGSQIADNVYVSARDAGNYLAGSVAKITGQSKLSFMLIAGAFNLHGNNKYDLALNLNNYKTEALKYPPYYGEDRRSNYFQRLGFEGIRTISEFNNKQSDIWRDRK